MIQSNQFNDQVVIVTGGTKGIGKHISLAFMELGAKVYALYQKDHLSAENFQKETQDFKHPAITYSLDAGKESDVENFFKWLQTKEEKLHVLVHSAGQKKDHLMIQMPSSDWHQVLNSNLNSAFYFMQKAAMIMLGARYGRIINISSIAANLHLGGQSNYSASKAALNSLTSSLATEVAKKNITVNTISPGFIDTDFIAHLPSELIDQYKKSVPMKRFGKPQDVAECALFLASKEASYITGSDIKISGGL
jgi:3-oxoacyl-[acyl-carrier protein] reductase